MAPSLLPPPYSTIHGRGRQYVIVSNLAIGPSPYVTGRIVQFTGSGGAYFFYIPTPAQVNGQFVSTATQINDNVTTSILMDFSDNTLYAALAVSIPGNDLSAQIVLGPSRECSPMPAGSERGAEQTKSTTCSTWDSTAEY